MYTHPNGNVICKFDGCPLVVVQGSKGLAILHTPTGTCNFLPAKDWKRFQVAVAAEFGTSLSDKASYYRFNPGMAEKVLKKAWELSRVFKTNPPPRKPDPIQEPTTQSGESMNKAIKIVMNGVVVEGNPEAIRCILGSQETANDDRQLATADVVEGLEETSPAGSVEVGEGREDPKQPRYLHIPKISPAESKQRGLLRVKECFQFLGLSISTKKGVPPTPEQCLNYDVYREFLDYMARSQLEGVVRDTSSGHGRSLRVPPPVLSTWIKSRKHFPQSVVVKLKAVGT